MIHLVIGVLFGAAALTGAPAGQVERTEAAIAALQANIQAFTVAVELASDMEQNGVKMNLRGTGMVEFMKKGEQTLYRTEIANKVDVMGSTMDQRTLTVCDGTAVYSQVDIMGQPVVVKSQAGGPAEVVPVSGQGMFDAIHKTFSVRVMPDEAVNKKMCHVLELTMLAQPGGGEAKSTQRLAKTRIYFSKETGLQQKLEMLDEAGVTRYLVKYSDFRLNPAIAPGRFTYIPPAGAKIVEKDKAP